ncbi:hypothetical protein G9A89_000426, partial [Geosiphon pyriformis]
MKSKTDGTTKHLKAHLPLMIILGNQLSQDTLCCRRKANAGGAGRVHRSWMCSYLSTDDHERWKTSALITCSDGSVTNSGGSFGFIFPTVYGQRLNTGSSMAPGAPANSFRSKAYGVLATLLWIEQSLHCQNAFPNGRLLPEQDVINVIVATIQPLLAPITFSWVKGHQDSTQAYDRLPFPAQLNCDADCLTGSFINPNPEQSLR